MVNEFGQPSDGNIENLVKASRAGKRQAFDELVRQYQQPAMRLAVRILGNAEDAADAVQDAFTRALLNLNTIKEPGRFGHWFLRIVGNAAISHLRTIRRRGRLNQANFSRNNKTATTSDPARDEELAIVIQKAMMKLSDRQAKAISLFGMKELSQNEVAEIMNCSVESVRWHVFEARKKLKELLKDYL